MKYIVMISIAVIVMNISNAHAATAWAGETSPTFAFNVMLFVWGYLGYMMVKQKD
jgi:hypothetical protein